MPVDDCTEFTIPNVRSSRWAMIAGMSIVASFLTAGCCVALTDVRLAMLFAIGVGSIMAAVLGLGLFSSQIVTGLRLSDELCPLPSKLGFMPADITRIDFGPDPAEDYGEALSATRLCEIKVRPVWRFATRLITSVGDARRLREWAIRHGIDVYDPTQILDDINVPPGFDDEERPGPSEITQSPS